MSKQVLFQQKLAYEETFSCVQCGYCLPSCPTYKTMEKETHSPRGRINLVKMAAEGKISLSELEEPIDLCLGCRACETACPTNVQYGAILESAKEAIQEEKNKTLNKSTKLLRKILFEKAFPNKAAMNTVSFGMSLYQATGLQKLNHKTGIGEKILPASLAAFEKITPDTTGRKRLTHVKPKGEPVFRIGFFTGCVMDTVFGKINDLSIRLLQEAGCEVEVIKEQTCCGALQHHSGEGETARSLAKKNIEAFERYDFDYVVNSIGGCGAALVEYDHLLKDDPEWAARAKEFSQRNADISVILAELTLPFRRKINKMVTYQPSCHMTNVQKRVTEPLSLIKSLPGAEYMELPDKNMCCGSAGIYNIVHYEESMNILDEKMSEVKKVKPDVIITTNPGCHLQMKHGVEREGMSGGTEVVHLVEILAEACGIEQ
ncbi:(Fe-S)-binding protein [Evansella sp. LMS18]|uniref:(Fe-S)-binding protein n=1 Tax=Evansella sp. LMS18 TaxID=2924033 RepID=UPI0020D08EFA|nr:(Fe-S)-binding protein [Evansella sp. LMS18]UTR12917.1 (Fe-S)-binding protein [Evansella sp. LMS18]